MTRASGARVTAPPSSVKLAALLMSFVAVAVAVEVDDGPVVDGR